MCMRGGVYKITIEEFKRGWKDIGEVREGRRNGTNTVNTCMKFSNLKSNKIGISSYHFKNTGLESKILLYCIAFQMKELSSARLFTILKSAGYSFSNIIHYTSYSWYRVHCLPLSSLYYSVTILSNFKPSSYF